MIDEESSYMGSLDFKRRTKKLPSHYTRYEDRNLLNQFHSRENNKEPKGFLKKTIASRMQSNNFTQLQELLEDTPSVSP